MYVFSRQELLNFNKEVIVNFGGLDYGEMEGRNASSLIARVENAIYYGQLPVDDPKLIACYWTEVIAKGHVFKDGNKRTALASLLVYCDMYDVKINISQAQLADLIEAIAESKIGYKDLNSSI